MVSPQRDDWRTGRDTGIGGAHRPRIDRGACRYARRHPGLVRRDGRFYERVHLEGIGWFRYTTVSAGKGVATKEEVSSDQITGLRVQFTPDRARNMSGGYNRSLIPDSGVVFMEWLGRDSDETQLPEEEQAITSGRDGTTGIENDTATRGGEYILKGNGILILGADGESLGKLTLRSQLDTPSPVENISTNTAINQLLGISNTIRVGAEVKVTPQFAVRAGYTWTGSGLGDALKEGNTEVVTVGTIPHYTLDQGITNYTVGFGYRFTPQFYADVACVFKTMKEDVYAFSPIYSNEGDLLATPTSASLKTNTTRVALTLGYKF